MKARQIAEITGGTLSGDPDTEILGPAPLEEAGPDHLAFLLDPKADREGEVGVLVAQAPPQKLRPRALILVGNPRLAMAQVLRHFWRLPHTFRGISPLAVLGEGVTLGKGVAVAPFAVIGDRVEIGDHAVIYPYVFIGDDARIGAHTVIFPGAYIGHDTWIGQRVQIGPNAVIGYDGFGHLRTPEGYRTIPQVGRVVIEDDCEIGAGTAIDRATLGETRIGRGTKLDNLVQVGHNVRIGPHTVIAAQSGIAGSTRIGAWVMMGGQVGVADHLVIEDGAIIGAKSGVTSNLKGGGRVYLGYFARERKAFLRALSLSRRLPELFERLRRLEKAVYGKETPHPKRER